MSKYKAGQSLLVIVLLISVVFTLIASASYRLTTETQSTKINQETVRTLAAADSGVEKGLQLLQSEPSGTKTFQEAGLTLEGVDADKSSINIQPEVGSEFVSPNVQKDDQYTFYLYDYPNGSTYYTNNMTIYFKGNSCGASRSTPALEITLIYGSNSDQIRRWLVEPCTSGPRIANSGGGAVLNATAGSYNLTVDGTSTNFDYAVNFNVLSSFAAPQLLITRTLFSGTKLGYKSVGTDFYQQGQSITSEAVSTTGVSKVVRLFRSYPQIPADFFVTTF